MEKEIAVHTSLYLKMEDGETKEEATHRFLDKLESVGIEWLGICEDDVEEREI